MSLCNVCSSIPFRKLITPESAAAVVEYDFKFNAAGRTRSVAWAELAWNERRCTIAEIVSRAKICSLCSYILLMTRQHTWKVWTMSQQDQMVAWEDVKTYIPRNVMVWMELPRPDSAFRCLKVFLGNPRRRVTRGLELQFRLDYGLVETDSPPTRRRRIPQVYFRETIHPKTLQHMVSWLDTCNSSHTECSHLTTRLVPLPTRVLDVSMLPGREQLLGKHEAWRDQFQGLKFKLLQTHKGQTGRYAALSYCWGTSLPLTTTTTNQKNHESNIGFDELPRTLQDAVMVVRYLGIEYIWIDCLCILQDSRADWEHESAHMADVYSNAYLTVAAARAEHCDEGFLGPREIPSPLCINAEDEEGSFDLYFQKYGIVGKRQPLYHRAWAAQESLLSYRVLSFQSQSMNWRCAHTNESENQFPSRFPSPRGNYLDLMAEALKEHGMGASPYSSWSSFTKDFTRREVTYGTDIFPAMAGIVQRIQKYTGDTFYVGMWKSHFFDGLSWHRIQHDYGKYSEKPKTLEKRQQWTAPSWSWASVVGKIDYSISWAPCDYCARLEECTITRSGSDPFSAPTAAFARITGPVTFITNVQDEKDFLEGRLTCEIQLGNGTSTTAHAMFDFVRYESCSVLMITPHWGLCIEEVEQATDTYVRIGTVEASRGLSWREGEKREEPLAVADYCPPRTITLL